MGGARVAHLALTDQIIKRSQGFLDGRARIGVVHHVKIDPVGLQPLQGGFAGFDDVAAGTAQLAAGVIHASAELGDQHDVLAPLPENFAQHGFGAAPAAIDIGAIEEVDAQIKRFVDEVAGVFEVKQPSDIVAAQADG